MKKIFLCILSPLFLCLAAFPQNPAALDFETLARTGTADEISTALAETPALRNQVFGTNRDTFLMLALRAGRGADIISECINGGCSAEYEARNGQTPLMVAARYCADENIIDLIVRASSLLDTTREEYVLKTDSEGYNAFDYARQNPDYAVYQRLLQYAEDPGGLYEQRDAPQIEEPPPPEETITPPANSTEPMAETAETSDSENVATEQAESMPPAPAADSVAIPPQINPPPGAQVEPPGSLIEEPTEEPGVSEEGLSLDEALAAISDMESSAGDESSIYLWDYATENESNTASFTGSELIENPNEADRHGITLLMKAARSGSDWDVDLLLQSGCDVNLRDKDGWTALMYAVRYQNSLEIVNKLIDNGAYIRVRNKYNVTPLLLAANYSQNPRILARLLQGRSALEDEVMRAFIFALTVSTLSPHVQQAKVKLFLDMGIPLNTLWKGETPLMYAAQYGISGAVIEQLLSAGADPLVQDENGRTAFDYAKENANLEHDDIYWSLNVNP